MSLKYGVKIKNIEASTLFEYNIGVRERYSYNQAMFSTSLFCDYLMENGLKIHKESSTRDIIGLEFNFGSRSYDDEIKHLDGMINKEQDETKKRFYQILKDKATVNKDKYKKLSKEQIRELFYRDGVNVTYNTFNKNGQVTKSETLHYKMLFRSTGKAKKGSCMFIVDRLYNKAINFLRMGIKLEDDNAPIVEISAYAPLISSTIVGKIHIDPDEILVIKDIDSFFKTNVVSIETDDKKHCVAIRRSDYELKNTMFDGQGLIDESIFPNWGDGYVLLRQHFCKMACFRTDIQKFFKDYFGEQYDTAYLKDMFGNKHKVSDIKLITTENAMKWVKFPVSYKYWSKWVRKNGSYFGVVKTAHKSKLGDVQRMSYQMVNSLSINIMSQVVEKSVEYINQLKTDDGVFLEYLEKNKNFYNDFEPLLALVNQNKDFLRCDYFRQRRYSIIQDYVNNFRRGKIIQDADNLVLVGSPYAMLLASVGEDVEKDDTFQQRDDCIECYTNRFDHDEYLAFFRSPHNSQNNIISLRNNKKSEIWNKYFYNLGNLILAVNVQHTPMQDRANGCDFDSDAGYVTNQEQIVEHAKYCYKTYPTIVNNIPKDKNRYNNTSQDFSDMDNKLSHAQLAIGESSNLAQVALSYSHNFSEQKYKDIVCILSVLAQVAIDNAKRTFDINLVEEIKRLKKELNIPKNKYPKFWKLIHSDFNIKNINNNLKCPMNYMSDLNLTSFRSSESTIPISEFFVKYETTNSERQKNRRVEELIEKYSLDLLNYHLCTEQDSSDYFLIKDNFEDMIEDIQSMYISSNYRSLYSWLLDRCFLITNAVKSNKQIIKSRVNKNKAILFKTLYTVNPKMFLECFQSKNDEK